MYVLGCSTSVVFHIRLEAVDGDVVSTTTYIADSSVNNSTSGDVFIVEATAMMVLIGRPDSDEVGAVYVECMVKRYLGWDEGFVFISSRTSKRSRKLLMSLLTPNFSQRCDDFLEYRGVHEE